MSDATTHVHTHAHADDHAAGEAAHAPRGAGPRDGVSLLESSACARLLGVSIGLAALWAGVFWALH